MQGGARGAGGCTEDEVEECREMQWAKPVAAKPAAAKSAAAKPAATKEDYSRPMKTIADESRPWQTKAL